VKFAKIEIHGGKGAADLGCKRGTAVGLRGGCVPTKNTEKGKRNCRAKRKKM